MNRAIAVTLLSISLGGCSAAAPRPPATPEPIAAPVAASEPAKAFSPAVTTIEARRLLAANRSRVWKDPDSVREAKIGEPFQCHSSEVTTCVCLEANARNAMGGMAGLKYYVIRLTTTQAEMIGEYFIPENCGRMTPFPEMNGRR